MSFEPIHEFFLADTARGATLDDFRKGVLAGSRIKRIAKIPAVFVEKRDGGKSAYALVAVHEGVAFYEVEAKGCGHTGQAADRKWISARIERRVNRAFDLADVVAVMGVPALLA